VQNPNTSGPVRVHIFKHENGTYGCGLRTGCTPVETDKGRKVVAEVEFIYASPDGKEPSIIDVLTSNIDAVNKKILQKKERRGKPRLRKSA